MRHPQPAAGATHGAAGREVIDVENLIDPYIRLIAVRDDAGVIVDFRYAAVNEAAARDYRLSRDLLLSSTLFEIAAMTGDDALFDRFVHVVESGVPLILEDFEYLEAPPTGITMYYDINATKIDDGLIVTWWDVTHRFERDRRIAADERQLRAVMETLLDPLQIFEAVRDHAGRLVDVRCTQVNEACVRYLGQARAELEGMQLRENARGEAMEVMFAWCRHVFTTGEPLILDAVGLTVDTGMLRRYDVRAVRVGDLVSLTYRDVTERVAAAQLIAEAKEHYRLVAENASEMVFQSDPAGRIEWVSPSVEWVLGYSPEQVIGTSFADYLHPDDLAHALMSQKARVSSDVRRGRAEVRMRTATGEHRWMAVIGKAITDDRDVIVGGIDAVRDIQDAKDAAAALEESEARFRHAMMDAATGMAIVAPDGKLQRVNPAFCAMLGRTEEAMLAASWQELTHPDDIGSDQNLADQVRRGERDVYRITKRYLKPDSTVVWADLSVSGVRDDAGEFLYYLSQVADITESVVARRALATSEEHYRLLAENSLDVIFRASTQGRLLWISPSVTEVFGWKPEELVGAPILNYLWREDLPEAAFDTTSPEVLDFEARVRQADGQPRWSDVSSRAVTDAMGAVVGRIGRLRDIGAKREAEEAVRRSEQRFRTAMESAPTGMAVVSLEREFLEVNPALCRLLGRTEEWLLSHGVADVVDPVDDELDVRLREQILAGIVPSLTLDHQMIRSDGRRVVVEQSVAMLRDSAGSPSGFVSQFADVTESRQARDRLRFLATHDSLTELLNRRELVARTAGILSETPRTGENTGVLFADIDQLKPINDSYGHGIGDRVIVTVARRIRDCVRTSDVVARFGGDEFVLVLPAVHTEQDVLRIAEQVQQAVRDPITVDGQIVEVTLSIGAVMVHPGSDPDDAFRCADQALYRAKRDGRDRTVIYDKRIDG